MRWLWMKADCHLTCVFEHLCVSESCVFVLGPDLASRFPVNIPVSENINIKWRWQSVFTLRSSECFSLPSLHCRNDIVCVFVSVNRAEKLTMK